MNSQRRLWLKVKQFSAALGQKTNKSCLVVACNARDYRRRRKTTFDSSVYPSIAVLLSSTAPFVLTNEEKADSENNHTAGQYLNNFPTFKLNAVKSHNNLENGVWVIFGHGVYDVTEFVQNHPGGDVILLAAGGDVGPYWNVYSQHHTQQVYDMLEQYRIGNLDLEDYKTLQQKAETIQDAYSNDPKRHPALIVRQQKPFNAETPPVIVVQNQFTPQSLFFVRNHMPVPDIKESDYKFHVEMSTTEKEIGLNGDCRGAVSSKSLTLEDLKKNFKPKTVEAVIQCSGNRRDDFNRYKEVKGLTWALTAISNATWTGVLLRDVLLFSTGMTEDELRQNFKHVQFEGYDSSADGTRYGASIPIHKAISTECDVLLAWELNGEPLSRDHGFPLRVVVPGTVGARSVKWLKSIRLSSEESNSHWQQKDYKMFHSSIDWSNVDWSKSPAVQDCPVQCAVCTPSPNTSIKTDSDLELKGYAYSGGGKGIVRVDVSLDGGNSWNQAELLDSDQEAPKEFGWRLWTFTVESDALKELMTKSNGKEIEVVVKATDSSHNVMPKDAKDVWNIRGIMNNSWHRIKLKLVD